MSKNFSGAFAGYCERFIEQKRAIGYRYISEAISIGHFDAFSIKYKAADSLRLTKKLVEAWTAKRPHEAEKTRLLRIAVIREFARFLISCGVEAYILPAQRKIALCNFKPYIFTPDEIARLFKAADKMERKTVSPYIHSIMPVLLRVLYGCGLRISEALNLRRCDVDIDRAVITVLNAKGDDNRLVAMSDSLKSVCAEYLKSIPELGDDAPFFPGRYGFTIDKRGIYSQYRKLLWAAGISHGGRGNGPRIHDLRHTFAVRAMEQLVDNGKDIYTTSPILSAYLGHKSLYATQRYLRLTAEAYPKIAEKLEAAFGSVVPGRPS